MATWSQIGSHVKPVALLNTLGYWDPLRQWLESAAAKGFVKDRNLRIMRWVDTPADLLPTFRDYEIEYVPKWMEPEDL